MHVRVVPFSPELTLRQMKEKRHGFWVRAWRVLWLSVVAGLCSVRPPRVSLYRNLARTLWLVPFRCCSSC